MLSLATRRSFAALHFLMRFSLSCNLHLVRYLEIFIVGGNGITGNLEANVYNTTFIRGLDLASDKDTSPQAWAESLSTDEIKEHFGALGAAINGPKLCMLTG